MSPFFPSRLRCKFNFTLNTIYQPLDSQPQTNYFIDTETPTKKMCTGQSHHFSACNHTQTTYATICSAVAAGKNNTACDRLEYAGVKAGGCPACTRLDEKIVRLREELREAVAERSGMQDGGEMALKEIVHGSGFSGGSGHGRDSVLRGKKNQHPAGKAERLLVTGELKRLQHDVLEFINVWWKKRSGYQATLSAFQVKTLGAISYKDRIAKCNKSRDELIKARLDEAEEELVRGYE